MNKVCPIILREVKREKEILIFEHPLAGFQLVKGTIEPDETLESASERELFEESGIVAKVACNLGIWESEYEDQIWGFCLMKFEQRLPEVWQHNTADRGGLTFRFSWYPLEKTPEGGWHSLFVSALNEVRKRVLSDF